MERRVAIEGDIEKVASVVRETARRNGLHSERIIEDQATLDRARIFSVNPKMGGVVLLEDPTGVQLSRIIGPEEFVRDVVSDLSREHVSLEPRAVLSNTS